MPVAMQEVHDSSKSGADASTDAMRCAGCYEERSAAMMPCSIA